MGFSLEAGAHRQAAQLFAVNRLAAIRDRRCLVLLIAFQLLLIAVIQPYGNFPINDDWAFAHSAIWFDAEHRVRLSNWTAMNLLPQTVAGGWVISAFGFSFDALRHLTQAVALLTSAGAFYFFRSAKFNPAQASVATLALIAMPSWSILANSFMTDLYCLVFAFPAAALFIRVLETPSIKTLAAATLLSILGILERQVVAVIPFAFLLAWFYGKREWNWRGIATGLAPFVIVVAAELLYQTYLRNGPGIPEAQQYTHSRVWPLVREMLMGAGNRPRFVGLNALAITGYLGLFLIGWMVWWGLPGKSRAARILYVALLVAAGAAALAYNWLPPFRPHNTIDAAGIGPFTLYDGLPRGIYPFDRSHGYLWRVAGIGAAFGGIALCGLMLATLVHLFRDKRQADGVRVFLAALSCCYLVPFVLTDFFDRYLLFVLPFLMALWARTWPADSAPLTRIVAITWILLVTAMSAAATHDYFAWNRARWDAIRYAEKIGAGVDKLDGGFEYNGFYGYETRARATRPGKSFWWIVDDEYVVAFSVVPGYAEVANFPVRAWLARTPPQVKLLRRQPKAPA